MNHSQVERVVGDVNIEGVRSLFKRSIAAAFHQLSKMHLNR
ncbi:MAG: hypothetical protein OXH83_08605 [Bryobacterales bacterium]|nr:hypothetical protein [Bryobacterales bacterium]